MFLYPSFMYWSIKYITWLLLFHLIILLMLSNFAKAGIVIYDGTFDVEEFSDLELPFTEPITKNGIPGVIVAAEPLHACINISRPPDVSKSLNWFVLISGNLCDYETKVVYSKLAGYSAAVIYSFRGRDEHPLPYRKHFAYIPHSNISAVLIRTVNGLKIKEKYLYTINDRVIVAREEIIFSPIRQTKYQTVETKAVVSNPLQLIDSTLSSLLIKGSVDQGRYRYRIVIYPNNSFNIMTFLLLFAIVAGLFLVIMLAFTIVRFIHQSHSVYRRRLSSRHLKQLQTFRYRKGDRYETCAICLEDYKDRDKLRVLPCSHGYHTKCIDPWLTNNRRICPVCKQKVILPGGFAGAFDSDSDVRAETTPLLSSTEGRAINHGTFSSTTDSVHIPVNVTASPNSESVASTSILPENEHNDQNDVCENVHKLS